MKIQEILLNEWFRKSEIDDVIIGDISQTCTGIAVSFLATMDVINISKMKNYNLIISHEGIFYTHNAMDQTFNSEMICMKKEVLQKHNQVVYRHHDAIHRILPDIITKSLVHKLQLSEYIVEESATYTICEVSDNKANKYINDFAKVLDDTHPKVYGNSNVNVQRIAILVGYRGGTNMLVPLFEKEKVDMIIFGEGPEWEIPYYIKDFNELNERQIVAYQIGHERSEQFGMIQFAQMLRQRYPEISVEYLES